jgi:hypothetical protein
MRNALIPGRNTGAMLSEAAATVIQGPKPSPAVSSRFYPQITQARVRSSPVNGEHVVGMSAANAGGANTAATGSIWQSQAHAQQNRGSNSPASRPEPFRRKSNSSGGLFGPSSVQQAGAQGTTHGRFRPHNDGQHVLVSHCLGFESETSTNALPSRPSQRTPSRTSSSHSKTGGDHSAQSAYANGFVTPRTQKNRPSINEFFRLDR